MKKILLFLLLPVICFGQIPEIQLGDGVKVTFTYDFDDPLNGGVENIIFNLFFVDSRNEITVLEVKGLGLSEIVADTVVIKDFDFDLPEGLYYLNLYAEKISNGKISEPGVSNVFEVIDSSSPSMPTNVVINGKAD